LSHNMDNLVVLHTRHALDLLGVLLGLFRLLGLLGNQLLQVLHLVLQVCGLSLDIALGGGQLILSVLQSGAGVIEVVGLEVTAAISPHQLIVHPLMCVSRRKFF
jgi:hypothetical protein